jgi:hypothetical protein
MGVRKDVRCFEEFGVPQPAHGAMLSVGPQNSLPESLLVHPAPHKCRNIGAPHDAFIRFCQCELFARKRAIVKGN